MQTIRLLVILGVVLALAGCASAAGTWVPLWYGEAEEWNELLKDIEEYELPGDRSVGAPRK